jgi:hypothetical protein
MVDPTDMIIPLLREMRAETAAQLREMRAENAALHEQTRALIQALDKRLGAVESAQNSYRQALIADTLLSRLVTGEFEERIGTLERKFRELEGQKVIDRAQLGRAIGGGRVLCCEIGCVLAHIRNVTKQAICGRALTPSPSAKRVTP